MPFLDRRSVRTPEQDAIWLEIRALGMGQKSSKSMANEEEIELE
jgi:hypothetical protein